MWRNLNKRNIPSAKKTRAASTWPSDTYVCLPTGHSWWLLSQRWVQEPKQCHMHGSRSKGSVFFQKAVQMDIATGAVGFKLSFLEASWAHTFFCHSSPPVLFVRCMAEWTAWLLNESFHYPARIPWCHLETGAQILPCTEPSFSWSPHSHPVSGKINKQTSKQNKKPQ